MMIDFKDVGLKEKKSACVSCFFFCKRLSACTWLRVECYEVVLNEKDIESSKGS